MAKGGKSKGKSSKTVDWVFCEACNGWFTFDKINLEEDIKKVSDEDFIFICKQCIPQKEKEFNSMKPDLKRQIGSIMDKHPTFATALIARRCFASKSDSNEYHFGRPGIPVTLRELEEKMERDVTSLDQFKHIATVMAERMVDSVKGEFTSEAKIIKTEIEKLLKNLDSGTDSPSAAVSSAKGKRGNKKANVTTTEEKVAKVTKIEAKPKPTRESRRGQKQKVDNANATPASKVTSEEDEKPAEDASKVNEVGSKPAAAAKQPRKKRGAAVAAKKESKAKKEEPPTIDTVQSSAVPIKEETKPQNEGNAKAKRGKKSTARGKKQQQNENVPSNDEKNEVTETKKGSEKEEAIKATTVASPNQAQKTTGGRKRKSGSALAPVNSNRGAKVLKTATAAATGTRVAAAKIITGSPGSPVAKIAIAGNNLVSLASLTQPLPPHVVLPTSPIDQNKLPPNVVLPRMPIAAPQVQNLKTSVAAPPPQVIQLRPAGTAVSSTGSSPTTTMQIRPLQRAAGSNAALGPRPQFFKIVGGKPVQISGSNVQRLPVGTASSLPGGQNRLVVMRGPMPSQAVQASGGAASIATAATSATAAASAAGPGNKIILLSNKGQGVNPTGGKAGQAAAPSIVRIVSPNNLTTSQGKVASLNPGSSPTKVTTLRQAVGASGPILFRTVAPRSANTTTSPPIQLPMAPLPKSALTSTPANNKKIVALPPQANDSSATAKAIQVLLPKSPLPPTTTTTTTTGTGTVNSSSGSPSKAIGGFTTTTTTTKNGAFVWTNSTRANFKLSSRINFASLDRFKNMVNKDVHFILASIKTEDNSNEFSFRLHLKREPVSSSGEQKGKKQSQQNIDYIEYLELEGKAKVPTAQEWSLKVKTEPPVFLVSKGNFLSDYPGARIPKEIADKPFVDYELHIDKCSPMQVAANANASAPTTTTAAPPPTRRGRKVAAK